LSVKSLLTMRSRSIAAVSARRTCTSSRIGSRWRSVMQLLMPFVGWAKSWMPFSTMRASSGACTSRTPSACPDTSAPIRTEYSALTR
jgi:hypothetical protein